MGTAPASLGDGLALTLLEGLTEADGETDGLSLLEGLKEAEGDTLGLTDDDGLTDALGLTDGLTLLLPPAAGRIDTPPIHQLVLVNVHVGVTVVAPVLVWPAP
jgi:hypothetical protein